MGIARQHGTRPDLNRGNTPHQNEAHPILEEAGYEFVRKTAHGGNLYRNTVTRFKIIVDSTPKNSSNKIGYLRQAIKNAPGGDVAASEVKQSPTAKFVAMADPFLLKEPTTKAGQAARRHALAGWIRRACEKHGPVEATELLAAAEEIGISRWVYEKARVDSGVVTYRDAGKNWVVLEHALPEGAKAAGRNRVSAPVSGVSVEVGENSGAGPEPREEDRETISCGPPFVRSDALSGVLSPSEGEPLVSAPPEIALKPLTPEMIERLPSATAVPGWDALRAVQPDPTAIPFQAEGDVQAAAQLLLQSLGLKTANPEVAAWAREAFGLLERAQSDIRVAMTRVDRIVRSFE